MDVTSVDHVGTGIEDVGRLNTFPSGGDAEPDDRDEAQARILLEGLSTPTPFMPGMFTSSRGTSGSSSAVAQRRQDLGAATDHREMTFGAQFLGEEMHLPQR